MTIVQQNSGTWTGVSSISVSLPGASSASNMVVVIIAGNTTVSTPSGWTLRTSQINFLGHYMWDRAGGSTSYTFTPVAGNGTWWIFEVQAGTYDTSLSANNTANATTYATPSLTPAAGNRHLFASIAADASGGIRTIAGWTNSFVEQIEAGGNNFPIQAGADVLVTAAGASYSTTATYSSGVVGRSAIIGSYGYGAAVADVLPDLVMAPIRRF